MTSLASQFYHPGEIRLQQSAGSRDKTEAMSRVLVKDHLIGQHRDFYAGLEYLFLSAVDSSGNLRPIMVSGARGFLSTPNEQILRIDTATSDATVQMGGPKLGAMVGVVGMDLSNRRRNRMHGRILAVCEAYIDIRVTQSYGNCPKYVNVRDLTAQFGPTETRVSANRSGLNDADRAAIRAADMFLIASYYDAGLGDPFEGADMSHRGGKPGFVRVAGDTLIIPDYFGNNLFNTLGNLVMNPVTALLFVDFETGDTRHLSGTAQVITDTARLTEHPKALRLLEVTVTGVISTTNATPLRWALRELSPYNPDPFLNLTPARGPK